MFGMYMRFEDGTVVKAKDQMEWSAWFETCNRSIAKDTVANALVSTVFLGIDHGFSEDGSPVLFETMVFVDGDMSGEFQHRYCTEEEAKAGHALAVKMLTEHLNSDKLLE